MRQTGSLERQPNDQTPNLEPPSKHVSKAFAPAVNRMSKRMRPGSAVTVQTIFEEDYVPQNSKSLPKLPSPVMMSAPHITIRRSPSNPANKHTLSGDDIAQRGLHIKIPNSSSTLRPQQSSPESISKTARPSPPPSSAISYLPSYYTSNDSRTPVVQDYKNQKASHPTLPPNRIPKPNRHSCASETSFESIDPDEATPPEDDDKQLSPVTESPISGIRYPKIPRSANQAVPRSLPQLQSYESKAPATQQVTLIAKRRGNEMAKDLERRLYMNDTSHKENTRPTRPSPPSGRAVYKGSEDSPLKGYGTGIRSGAARYQTDNSDLKPPEATPKSPPWELTPTRRGDTLFISVH
ncbi:hypothetical protein MBLNU459_g0982t1 [Dothideomycetes sp. NU459]